MVSGGGGGSASSPEFVRIQVRSWLFSCSTVLSRSRSRSRSSTRTCSLRRSASFSSWRCSSFWRLRSREMRACSRFRSRRMSLRCFSLSPSPPPPPPSSLSSSARVRFGAPRARAPGGGRGGRPPDAAGRLRSRGSAPRGDESAATAAAYVRSARFASPAT